MPYKFNPHRHVKIWLSKEADLFMPIENRMNLVEMHQKNPSDEIYLVYDHRLLSKKEEINLQKFCACNKIKPINVVSDIEPNCKTIQEKELLDCYQKEIAAIGKGGNLAAASDILRWIGAVYNLGTYTDFDIKVDTHLLPNNINVDFPILLNIGSVSIRGANILSLNNDVIAVVNSDAALSNIQSIQNGILNSYQNHEKNFSYSTYLDDCIKKIEGVIPIFLVNFLKSLANLQINAMAELDAIQNESEKKWLTPIDIRAKLENEKKHIPEKFINRVFRVLGLAPEIKAESLRIYFRNKTGWLAWLTMPQNEYNAMCERIFFDDNTLCNIMVEEVYNALYMQTVIASTGPSVVLPALFKEYSLNADTLRPYTFKCYGLESAFQLDSALPLGASFCKAMATLAACDKPSEIRHLSWTGRGHAAQKLREELIKTEFDKLPQEFLELKEDIQYHITRIEADLNGTFSFYRESARHAKINALKKILSALDGDHDKLLDVESLVKELQDFDNKYPGFDASLGKSKTQALIEKFKKNIFFAVSCERSGMGRVMLKRDSSSEDSWPIASLLTS